MVPPEAKEKISQPRGEKPSVLEELKKRFGWQDANPIQIQAGRDSGRGPTALTAVLRVPLSPLPFREGDTTVQTGESSKVFIQSLREALELARKEVPNAALLIVGQVLDNEGITERERDLLRTLRMLAFASWFAEHELGDPKSLPPLVLTPVAIGASSSGSTTVASRVSHLSSNPHQGASNQVRAQGSLLKRRLSPCWAL